MKHQELGNTYLFEWEKEHIKAHIERVYQHSRGEVSAEVSFRVDDGSELGQLIHRSHCSNLLGTPTRRAIAKDCAEKFKGLSFEEWLALVESATNHVVARSREGSPLELLIDVELDQESEYLLYPFIHKGDVTVLFGKGKSLKSTLAGWLAIRVAYGMECEGGNVCILDWESSPQAWARRLREVASGMEMEEPPPNIYYRRMHAALADDVEAVYRIGAEQNIDLWIADSAMWACGGEPEKAEPVANLFRSLRSLGGSTLMIGHVNNEENTKRPYGNVMWVNAPRSLIQVQKSELSDGDEVLVSLTQTHTNIGKPFPPMGFRGTFHVQDPQRYTPGDYVLLEETDPLDTEDLAENVSLPKRITHLLSHGRMARHEIASELGIFDARKAKTLQSTIDRMVREGRLTRLADNCVGLADGTFQRGAGYER